MECQLQPDTRLRKLIARDAAELFALVDNNRAHLREWLPWVDGCTSVEDSRQFILSVMSQDSHNLGCQCAIVRGARIVGVAGFHPIDWMRKCGGLGYWIGQSESGHGIVTAAVRALTAHAFDHYGLHRVELRIASGNHRSQRVAQRLRMPRTGLVKQAERLHHGWVDHVVYAVDRPRAALNRQSVSASSPPHPPPRSPADAPT